MGVFLEDPPDFKAHNEEVRRVWETFEAGKPSRVPVSITGSITNYIQNPWLNIHGYSFRDYFENTEVQINAQLEYQDYQRHNWVCDRPMGLPDDGWTLFVDFQNSYDASWFGCETVYFDGYLPDTLPMLAERKEKLYDLPDTLPADGGLIGRGIEFRAAMKDYCAGREYKGRPVIPPKTYLGEGTDGVLDLAYKLRGAENILLDMYEDEEYYGDLMEYITHNLINRMTALREKRWAEEPRSDDYRKMRVKNYGFADDAITLISHKDYMDYVYPYQKRILDAFSDGDGLAVHLCGANAQHFEGLAKTLKVKKFDTGFPVNFGQMRGLVGPDAIIQGGPPVMLVKDGTPDEIEAEAIKILKSGVADSGRFIMIAANNLAPRTPVENIRALYDAVKKHGTYRRN